MNDRGATLVEFSFVCFLLVISLLAIIYLSLFIAFCSGVGHSLTLGIKTAQTDPENIEDIFSASSSDPEYLSFRSWRDDILEQTVNSDVSLLHRGPFELSTLEIDDGVLGASRHSGPIALLLPGQAIRVLPPQGSSAQPYWISHSQICPLDVSIPCNQGRRRTATETLPDLLAEYPAQMLSVPYLSIIPDFQMAPITSVGYIAERSYAAEPPAP